MTDPKRGDDPIEVAGKLPEGAAIIYRHFCADNAKEVAREMREVTQERGLQFLIGADPMLAREVEADGVHFRRNDNLREPALWRLKEPDWLITMAALKGDQAYEDRDDLAALDGLFVSSVFASKSPSAGEPIGIERFKEICADLPAPIYALGGVSANTAKQLIGTGAAGLASISGITKEITMAEITVEATPNGHRFVYRKNGHKDAELTMKRVDDDLFNANHTGVPKSMGGQGIGKALIKFMGDHAREHNYRVIPGCPFVGAMWKRHPDWAKDITE